MEPIFFSYVGHGPEARPLLPLTLSANENSVDVLGLIDSGSSISVLPYSIGLALGFVWEEQKWPVHLGGHLASVPAMPIFVEGKIGDFPQKRLGFAWSRSEDTPLLLGQVNFFTEFDICFMGAESRFSLRDRPA